MDFQEAIRKIEERGDFNRFAEVKPVFEDKLKKLPKGNHLERGLCNYYILVGYLKAHLVHETEESIAYYEAMDDAFVAQWDAIRKTPKDFSWSEITDFYRLMDRCYGALEFLYNQHDFKSRKLLAYIRRMDIRKSSYVFSRHYGKYFQYTFLRLTSNYGTSTLRWSGTIFTFVFVMAGLYWLVDLSVEPSLKTIPTDAHWFDYLYFSMVTMTTVGFGDIVPHAPIVKAIVTLEAFFGFVMIGIFLGLIQKKF